MASEERAILASIERGEWQSVTDVEAEKLRYQEITRANLCGGARADKLLKQLPEE